ncbi:MAG: VacJ family lipoprotein [Cocleimonas sp.]
MISNNKNTFWAIVLIAVFLTSCSQTGSEAISSKEMSDQATKDTYVNINRRIYRFNAGLDHYLVKPVARSYQSVTPPFLNTSISNFFLNLGDIGNTFNNILQAKPLDAVNDAERFIFNSTFGLAGLLDVASAAGLEKHDEDFGQTLAAWGVGSGPYIMLPFLGPSTLRDATAKLSVDQLTNLANYSEKSIPFFLVEKLDLRAGLFSKEAAFKDISDDSYSAIRDAWLQRRDYLIRDGKVDEDTEMDLIDELESLE